MKKLFFAVIAIALLLSTDIIACTSAIITGKATPNGKPLLWKHRDTGELNNKVKFFKGEKYSFYALINSPDAMKQEAWTGTNEVGFSIMNTASYNLKNDDVPSDQMDKEGVDLDSRSAKMNAGNINPKLQELIVNRSQFANTVLGNDNFRADNRNIVAGEQISKSDVRSKDFHPCSFRWR